MKKIRLLLSVLALAFFASACSSPMGPVAADANAPLTSAEAYSWTKPTTKPSGTKYKLPDTIRKATGYALGM